VCLGEVDLEIHQDVFLEPQVLTRHRSDMEAGKIWLQQITGFLVPYLWLCTNTDTHTPPWNWKYVGYIQSRSTGCIDIFMTRMYIHYIYIYIFTSFHIYIPCIVLIVCSTYHKTHVDSRYIHISSYIMYIMIYHHISSYIIIYRHISSHIIMYHHLSSYIVICLHISILYIIYTLYIYWYMHVMYTLISMYTARPGTVCPEG
jgi:hypothetical protein